MAKKLVEAEVPRNALTQGHTDLRNQFYEQIRTRGDVPDSEKRLRKQIAKLEELRASDAAEIQQLKADVEALVGPCTSHNWRVSNFVNRADPA